MICFILGFVVTLIGAFAGEWLVERWDLGPKGAISLGWMMGMAFGVVVFAISMSAP
jgi:ABC-type Mn2+/Zn2+ transport system permease subunit